MAKQILAEKWTHISNFGKAVFSCVPILVEDSFPGTGGTHSIRSNDKRIIGPNGEIVTQMEREVAKQWLLHFIEKERSLLSISADEIYAILLIFGINKTQFSRLLKIDKGTMTKYVAGTLTPPAPVTQLMLIYLAAELTKLGTAQSLARGAGSLTKMPLMVPEPNFVIKKVKKEPPKKNAKKSQKKVA